MKKETLLKYLVRMDGSEIVHNKQIVKLESLMNDVEIKFREKRSVPEEETDINTLRSLSVLAEACDQCGDYERGIDLIERWARYYQIELSYLKREIRRYSTQAEDDASFYSVTKQKIWICLIYAHLLYRDEEYRLALQYLELCGYVVEHILLAPDEINRSLFGTRSRIAYQKALILHELDDVENAREYGQKALDLSFKRLANEKQNILENYEKDSELQNRKLEREEVLARHTYAKVQSFCQARYLRAGGKLTECLQMLEIGQVCLSDASKKLVQKNLIELEIAITKRLLVEDDLTQRYSVLKNFDHILEELQHTDVHYRYKALVEKGLTLVNLLDTKKHLLETEDLEYANLLGKTENFVNEIIALAENQNWRWRVYLLKARLELIKDSPESALESSETALQFSKKAEHKMGEIRAYLEKGKSLYVMKDYNGAIVTFETALEQCKKHETTRAFCHLFLARCHYFKSEFTDPFENLKLSYRHWASYKRVSMEHGDIIAIAKRFGKNFKDMQESFFLPTWKYDNALELKLPAKINELKLWLYKQAVVVLEENGKLPTDENIAEILGYKSHTSVANLRSEAEITSPKKRGRKPKTGKLI